MNWVLMLLALAAASQSAAAQDGSRGAGGYSQPLLRPAKPTLDAEEAFKAGDRKPLPEPRCDRAGAKCKQLVKYVEEYNRTIEGLQRKYPQ